MTAQRIAERLHARRSGSGWIAKCPAHEDRVDSLSISESKSDGRVLLHCHAGCTIESVLAAAGLEMRDLFPEVGPAPRMVAEYNYLDERGELLFQAVRYEPKGFRQRRPDGNGGWNWNLNGTRHVLYSLPEVINAESVLVVEGEKDVEAARKLGLTATCNSGGAGKWRDEYSETLRGKRVAIIADADEPGRKHVQQVATSLHGKAATAKVLELPDAKDLSEWVERGGTREALLELIRNAPEWKPEAVPSSKKGNPVNPWSSAIGMDVFLGDEEEAVKFLYAPVIAKEAITEIFAPRGLGKSLWALFVAVYLARAGYKVLVIDRDNPRRVVRERLRSFGATRDLTTLKVLSREDAPPLTNTRAWAEFPYYEYDLVILDAIDSAAEGVGEQDSTKPSLAIAPLLDIARRENGPAVLLLGNTIKSAAHSRGSGVIEDRADIVFEVRDATNFHPTGEKPWIEELPAADAGSWAGRSKRRKRLSKYRLAFIATKFRIGEEPEPFIIEIDLTTEPWTVRDVTDEVDREGAAERGRAAEERAAVIRAAAESLKVEILRREMSGEPVLIKKQAEDFLVSRRNTRKVAREVINSPAFEIVPLTGKGHPNGVRVAGKNDDRGGNGSLTKAAPNEGSSNGDFGRPHPEHSAEMPPNKTPYPCVSRSSPISAEPTLFTDPDGTEAASVEPLDDPDDEVAL
jgi:5S rRNA maturation endonuclease (ribonuclease M5)